jgi:hypothetical protein
MVAYANNSDAIDCRNIDNICADEPSVTVHIRTVLKMKYGDKAFLVLGSILLPIGMIMWALSYTFGLGLAAIGAALLIIFVVR